jgi:hypothetical protein
MSKISRRDTVENEGHIQSSTRPLTLSVKSGIVGSVRGKWFSSSRCKLHILLRDIYYYSGIASSQSSSHHQHTALRVIPIQSHNNIPNYSPEAVTINSHTRYITAPSITFVQYRSHCPDLHNRHIQHRTNNRKDHGDTNLRICPTRHASYLRNHPRVTVRSDFHSCARKRKTLRRASPGEYRTGFEATFCTTASLYSVRPLQSRIHDGGVCHGLSTWHRSSDEQSIRYTCGCMVVCELRDL